MGKTGVMARIGSIAEGTAVCWMGNAGWLVRSGGRLIAFDLDLNPGGLREVPPPASAQEVAPALDVHFVTHEHEDHFNTATCRALADRGRCLFVLPVNNVAKGLQVGIPESRIRVARPGEAFELDGLRVEPLRALHGHRDFAVFKGANMEDCGYLVTAGGRRVLHPGDSVLLDEHLALGGVDVLFVSPTVHNTYVDRSVTLIAALRPAFIFPQHYGTYRQDERNEFWTKGYPDELLAALPDEMRARYHKVAPGEVFVIP